MVKGPMSSELRGAAGDAGLVGAGDEVDAAKKFEETRAGEPVELVEAALFNGDDARALHDSEMLRDGGDVGAD